MDEIQRNVIKRGKRNSIARLFRGDDKEAIDTWRLNFNRVLHVFNVRSVTSAWPLLTSRFQTELVMSADLTVSEARHDVRTDVYHDTPDADKVIPSHDVSNTHPEVRGDIANTRTTASDIHRGKLKRHEDVGGQNQAVSITHTLTVTE